MLNKQTANFASRVWIAASELGNSAPKIADQIINNIFPRTAEEARQEGAFKMFRVGLISEIKRILRAGEDVDTQIDFADSDEQFGHVVAELKSKTYFVPSLDQYVSISSLIADPSFLDEARRFMRQKGDECLAEAKRLDDLYDLVTS